jgi:hypothetical protein
MIDYRQQDERDCPPQKEPAPQPPTPGNECEDLPTTTPPALEEPKECPPDKDCNCPPTPTSTSTCLEDLIASQTAQITAAEQAKAFKADLEALLAMAKVASQEYTRAKHDELLDEWKKQDRDISELIRKLVCAVPCWRCVIECHVCPLLNELHYAEQWLHGEGKLYDEVHDLHDLHYWHQRDLQAKQRRFLRIKTTLAAWEKPAQTIEKILSDDRKLIDDAGKALGADATKVVYDVFLRLVPMHLAIAPPAGPGTTTTIGEEYTEFCRCDEGKPDTCCGPDVGEWSLRQRLIGPHPYLIEPNDYFKLVCCLVENRYGPAKDAVAAAEAAVQAIGDRIARYETQIVDGLKTFDRDAKGAIPSVVECEDYEPRGAETQAS